jgi:hypothetical protein
MAGHAASRGVISPVHAGDLAGVDVATARLAVGDDDAARQGAPEELSEREWDVLRLLDSDLSTG